MIGHPFDLTLAAVRYDWIFLTATEERLGAADNTFGND